jgi:hypothetical protein
MSMFDNLKDGMSLVKKTMPFIFLNLTVYGIFAGATLFYFLMVGGLCYLLKSLAGLIFLAGLGLYGVIAYYVREYVLYLIKAAHIAVITELMLNGKVPEDKSQVEYGKNMVKTRVKDVSILFAIDQLVKGVLKGLNRLIVSIADWVPLPGLDKIAGVVMAIINLSMTYVDEAILSYSFVRKQENPWTTAKEGVVLYAQAYKTILKNAVILGVIGFFAFIALVLILMVPGLALGALFPKMSTALGIAVLVIAYLVKLALYDPIALCTIILTYHRAIQGLTPNPEWERKLDQVSSKFRQLKTKAAEWGNSGSQPETGGAVPNP